MEDFRAEITKRERQLETIASAAVEQAVKAGADECAVNVAGAQGLSVSSRDGEVENVEFNRDNGLSLVVYKGGRKGSVSTTDLSADAITQAVDSALRLAGFSDPDPCAGLPERDLLCTDFKGLEVLHAGFKSPDEAVELAVAIDKLALDKVGGKLKGSDGASADYSVYTRCLATSQGFCHAASSSIASTDLTLLGETSGVMQRGYGFSVSRGTATLDAPKKTVDEAVRRTLDKLDARTVKTGTYNVIFTRGAVQSLMANFLSATYGGAIYRHNSFLCGKLTEQVMPEFVTLREDPWIKGSLGAANCDGEGVRAVPMEIVSKGNLQAYLMSSYSSRKLKLRSNGHSGGYHNMFVEFDPEHTRDFAALLAEAGEGIVVDELMGQGVDLTSGNYSRGAAGFYFKNGKREYAVSEITVAGNLKDMFMRMALIGTDRDPRYKLQCGSILIPGMTVSGS